MSELRTEYEKELKALQRQLHAAKAEHEAAQALMQKRIDDPSRDMAERDAELAKTRATHEQSDKERAERDDEISRLSTETRMLQTQLRERKECNKTMKSDMRHLQAEVDSKSIIASLRNTMAQWQSQLEDRSKDKECAARPSPKTTAELETLVKAPEATAALLTVA
jgi:chromosome segregation ATPase